MKPLTPMHRRDQQCADAYYVEIRIGMVEIMALVDTGAMVSTLTVDILNQNGELKKLLSPSELLTIAGLGNKAVDVLGELHVPIQLGTLKSEHHRIVITESDGGTFPCILGLDFLDAYQIQVDTKDRVMRYQPKTGRQQIIPLQVSFCDTHDDSEVTAIRKLVIPGRTGRLIDVKVSANDKMEGCIEGSNALPAGCLVARSLNMVRNNHTKIEIINVLETPIVIERGQLLAEFEPLCAVCGVTAIPASTNTGPEMDEVEKTELFNLDDTSLTRPQKNIVKEFLRRHHHVIGRDENDLGLTQTVEHTIDIQGAEPIKQRYRRFAPPMQKEINRELDKLLKQGIIEPSMSPWASPLVPVRKKNGKLRICVDFRAVNGVTKKDSFPLPCIADAVNHFRGSCFFSSLDLLAGYHQIPLSTASKEITAFSTGEELYQYTRLPFGLTNAPAAFSRLINIVMAGFSLDKAQTYLDDILIAGYDFEDHLRNLQDVFVRLSKHGLKLNANKCELFKQKVNYLGHEITKEGIRPLADNIQAIVEFPIPRTVKQVRRFNGMVNFYRKFLQNAVINLKPLYVATTGKNLAWTKECARAFQWAKEALIAAPILAYPMFEEDQEFIVTTDASATGAGAVLTQRQDDSEKVIAYAGVSFNETQKRYSVTDKELAAIRFAVQHFKPYLYGRHFIIRTDHEPLVYLNHMKRVDDRLHRTLEDLAVGHYRLEYVPGKANVVADTLSRAEYPWVMPHEDEYLARTEELEFDTSNWILKLVPGGPSSLFESLGRVLNIPNGNSQSLRETLIDILLKKPTQYGFTATMKDIKLIRAWKDEQSFPPFVMLQVCADEWRCNIIIHQMGGQEIVVRNRNNDAGENIHLECLGGVHFNYYLPKIPEKWSDESKKLKDDIRNLSQSQVATRFDPRKDVVMPRKGLSKQKLTLERTQENTDKNKERRFESAGTGRLTRKNIKRPGLAKHTLRNGSNGVDKEKEERTQLNGRNNTEEQYKFLTFIGDYVKRTKKITKERTIAEDQCKFIAFFKDYVMRSCASRQERGTKFKSLQKGLRNRKCAPQEEKNKTFSRRNVDTPIRVEDREVSARVTRLDPLKFDSEIDQWQLHQLNDYKLVELMYHAKKGTVKKFLNNLPVSSLDRQEFLEFGHVVDQLVMNDGMLCYKRENADGIILVPVAPLESVRSLCKQMHEVLGHAGREKVLKMIKNYFFHPRIYRMVIQIIQECSLCQEFKGRTVHEYPLEQRVAERPYQCYAMDLMDLPKTKTGYVTLMVGIDRYTRFGHAVPLRNKTSRLVAGALESHILSSVPITPEAILTDGGPEFKGKEFNEVLNRFGIRHDFSLPYRPHTNGGVERFNQTLKNKLMLVSADRKREWDKVLYEVLAQYNRTVHSETGKAPVEFFSREIPQLNSPREKTYWRQKKKGFRPFQAGDLVMRKIPFQPAGQYSKLAPVFEGPYTVEKFLESDVVYRIVRVRDGFVVPRVHISQLKKYYVPLEEAVEQQTVVPKFKVTPRKKRNTRGTENKRNMNREVDRELVPDAEDTAEEIFGGFGSTEKAFTGRGNNENARQESKTLSRGDYSEAEKKPFPLLEQWRQFETFNLTSSSEEIPDQRRHSGQETITLHDASTNAGSGYDPDDDEMDVPPGWAPEETDFKALTLLSEQGSMAPTVEDLGEDVERSIPPPRFSLTETNSAYSNEVPIENSQYPREEDRIEREEPNSESSQGEIWEDTVEGPLTPALVLEINNEASDGAVTEDLGASAENIIDSSLMGEIGPPTLASTPEEAPGLRRSSRTTRGQLPSWMQRDFQY